jgi:membrane protease YdiL (CAAX protease family)
MRLFRYLSNNQPLVCAIFLVLGTLVLAATLRNLLALRLDGALLEAGARLGAALLLLMILARGTSLEVPAIAKPPSQWGERWWLPTLAMAPLILPRYVADAADLSGLTYSPKHARDLLLFSASSGFFEEVLFRGACYTLLCRAWASTRAGLHRSAATQALLFGLIHFSNLASHDLAYVLFQFCFATLVGYGFAGLTSFSRSLWPAIVLHTAINAVGNIDNHFADPGYNFPVDTPLTMIAIIAAFFVFGALPGYWCLQRVPLTPRPHPAAAIPHPIA